MVSSSACMPGMHWRTAVQSSPRMEALSASSSHGLLPIHSLPRLRSSCRLSPWTQQAAGKQLPVTQIVFGQGQPGLQGATYRTQFGVLGALTSWPERQRQVVSGPRATRLLGSRRQSAPGLQRPDRLRDTSSSGW